MNKDTRAPELGWISHVSGYAKCLLAQDHISPAATDDQALKTEMG